MQKNWKKIASTVCLILFVVSVLPTQISGQTDTKKAAGDYSARFVLTFSKQDLTFSTMNGFDIVGLNDCDFLNEVGKPQVPVKTIQIAVPAGIHIDIVAVESTITEQLPGQYLLYPGQPAIPTNVAENTASFIQPDTTTYASTQPYPSQTIVFTDETDLAGQPIGEFTVYPVHYQPSEKTLTLDTSITFVVTGQSG
jgi:hypothetical protein